MNIRQKRTITIEPTSNDYEKNKGKSRRRYPVTGFLHLGDFPTDGKPRQREENSPSRHRVFRSTTEKANARMQKARCPQQLGSCRRQAGPASKRSRSIERSEFCCEDNGKNTPGNAWKEVIQMMDLKCRIPTSFSNCMRVLQMRLFWERKKFYPNALQNNSALAKICSTLKFWIEYRTKDIFPYERHKYFKNAVWILHTFSFFPSSICNDGKLTAVMKKWTYS